MSDSRCNISTHLIQDVNLRCLLLLWPYYHKKTTYNEALSDAGTMAKEEILWLCLLRGLSPELFVEGGI